MARKADELQILIKKSNGILKTSDVLEAGFAKEAFYSFVKKQNLEKASQGIYVEPGAWTDDMHLLQLRFPKAVFSYETALYLHDMSETEPVPLTVTVSAKYNAPALLKQAKVYYVKNEWYGIGITKVKSPDGFSVFTYDKERTVCDIIRKQKSMDIAAFNYALNQYVRSSDKNYTKLMKYAKEFQMEKRIRTVMGVLL